MHSLKDTNLISKISKVPESPKFYQRTPASAEYNIIGNGVGPVGYGTDVFKVFSRILALKKYRIGLGFVEPGVFKEKQLTFYKFIIFIGFEKTVEPK